jgi:hypothetical protein
MRVIIRRVLFAAILGQAAVNLANASQPCPDINKIERIGKELMATYQQDICTKEITPSQVKWLTEEILPQMMSKEFLGVNPPPNWQFLADVVINDCYQQGNLCSKTVQKEFANCVVGKMPFIFLQTGPWLAENCEKINATVVLSWPQKKASVEGWIMAFLQKIKT